MIGSGLTRFHTGGFLAIDHEGEGLNLYTSRPWQVAWGLFDLKTIHWIKTRYIWFPDLVVSRGAAAKTRFDPVAYKAKAQPAKEVLDEYLADINNPAYRIVWQAGFTYDLYVKRNWERACGVASDESYLLRTIDTSCILKAQLKNWTPDASTPEAFLAWQYKASDYIETGLKTNLTHIGKARKIDHDYTGTHEAANDITLMAKIFQQVVYEVEF